MAKKGELDDALSNAFTLFVQIGGTSSKKEKDALLKQGVKNKIFKQLVCATYDPFVKYYVKKLPNITPTTRHKDTPTDRYRAFTELLNDLSSRNITGNAALDTITKVLSSCGPTEAMWYSKVLQKDLKIGVTEKSINKVSPGLIPVFSCMLAHSFKKYPARFIAQKKLDGDRCLAFHYEDRVELLSRNGHLILGYDDLEAEIANYTAVGYVYDGEILSGDYNSTRSTVSKKGVKGKHGVLNVFDALPIDEFFEGTSSRTLEYRYHDLYSGVLIGKGTLSISVVPCLGFPKGLAEADDAKVLEFYESRLDDGDEGIVIKDLDSYYECKRTYSFQKLKPTDTIDLTIIGVEEGSKGTKNESKLGALVCELPGGTVHIGGGFSDAQRKQFWEHRSDLINRTVEVKYDKLTKNQNGTTSLRFPRFKSIRYDK